MNQDNQTLVKLIAQMSTKTGDAIKVNPETIHKGAKFACAARFANSVGTIIGSHAHVQKKMNRWKPF